MTSVASIEQRAARDVRKANGAAEKSTIRIRNAAEVAQNIGQSAWLLRPYLERDAISVLYGDYGTYKSFVAVDWAMRIALGLPALGFTWPAKRTDVLLISAEGRALPQRLRAWCLKNFRDESFSKVLARASLYCVEHPVNLSDPTAAVSLIAAINDLAIEPGLIIIDTMSRNSDGRIENSTSDAGAYLSIIDTGLRARYRCAILLTHHVGHVEKGRIRGPIVLAANTDTLIRIERPDKEQRAATLTIERLKDSEPPAPQGVQACVIEVGETDADGQPITSLALEAADPLPVQSAAAHPELRGKAQRQLLAALRAQDKAASSVWTLAELREIGRKAGMQKGTARAAAEALSLSPFMTGMMGGWRLSDAQG